MDDITTYTWNKQIASYEVDSRNRLRLSAILRLMQESGDRHTAAEKLPYEETVSRVCMVLISRSAVQVHRYPTVREELTITTLQRAVRGVRMYRDFIFRVGEEIVIEATNEYFCADRETRRVIKPDVYLKSGIQMNQSFVPTNPQPKRITLPEEMLPAGERKVFRSMEDNNGHLNNAWYADFALDALPDELLCRPVKNMFTGYVHEALPGSTLKLFAAQSGQSAFVRGDLPEQQSFAAEFDYE